MERPPLGWKRTYRLWSERQVALHNRATADDETSVCEVSSAARGIRVSRVSAGGSSPWGSRGETSVMRWID